MRGLGKQHNGLSKQTFMPEALEVLFSILEITKNQIGEHPC